MLKLLAIGLFGLVLILAPAALASGIEMKLEATPELTEIVTVTDEALPTIDKTIIAFAKSNHFQWSMGYGPKRHKLLAELERHDLSLIVTNPFPNRREVHLFVYRAPNSQIARTEMEDLLKELKCQLLSSCK